MRKVLSIAALFFLTGCVAATLPQYLSDKHPYKKEFFTAYDQSVEAVKASLEELGWKVKGEGDPAVYERQAAAGEKAVILFSEIRATPLFLGSRYSKLNVIVRGIQDKTEIEIRYVIVAFKKLMTEISEGVCKLNVTFGAIPSISIVLFTAQSGFPSISYAKQFQVYVPEGS